MSADSAPLAVEIRRRLGPVPELSEWPFVSIVVLNRDGAAMLRRLLAGLAEFTDYPNFELILVDNASSDESLDLVRGVEAPFPISILANSHNESFSDACNQGAELAQGELLLFLNNDTEPFEAGWLRELVFCLQKQEAGAVAATLICSDREHEASFDYGYGVQHRGLEFREEDDGMIHPALRGWEADPLDERLGRDERCRAVAAACVLIGRGAFGRAGGFTHGYVYGAEDIDLCLKLRAAGFEVILSGRSIAIHHPVSTRRAAPFEQERARKLANRRVLWEHWGPQLRREYELDRPGSDGAWPAGFCLKAADPTACDLDAACAAFEARGHRCLVLSGDRAESPIGLNYEVAVHCGGGRYVPKPGQLNVLWNSDGAAHDEFETSRYDLVVDGSVDSLLSATEAVVEPREGIHT